MSPRDQAPAPRRRAGRAAALNVLIVGLSLGCEIVAPSVDDAGAVSAADARPGPEAGGPDVGGPEAGRSDAGPGEADAGPDAVPGEADAGPDDEPLKRYDRARAEAELRQMAGCGAGIRSIYVSAPIWAEAPPEGFRADLQVALAGEVGGALGEAFCRPGANGAVDDCAAPHGGVITVEVDPVLDARTGPETPAWRHDGHRRFFRVWFRGADAPRPARWIPFTDALQIRPERLCAVMAAVRAQAGPGLLVGRGWCTVRVSGLEDQIDACHPLARWHLDRLGLESPAPAGQSEISIIDSRYGASVGAGRPADAASSGDTPDPDPSLAGLDGVLIDHGVAMVNLAHQASGQAFIRAVRGLNDAGLGTPASIARAFDAVLLPSVATGLAPSARVFNFSLGWPPELEQRRRVPVEGCALEEDPQGGPLRYLLAGARLMDTPESPVLVVAAAGNRPRLDDRARLYGEAAGTGEDPCGGAVPGAELFFPAQWARRPTCGADGAARGPLVLAVGGVDMRDAQSGLAQPEVEPLLVAPGEHVYALEDTCDGGPGAGLAPPGCDRAEGGGRVFSGSSVAAALVSGVAARADQRLRDAGLALDGLGLGRLLYALGEPLCRDALRHRVSARRIDQAFLRCPVDTQENLVGCIERLPRAAPLHDVAALLDQCAANTVGLCAPITDSCALDSTTWPAGFALAACVPNPQPDGPAAWVDCGAGAPCGPVEGLEAVVAGGLGPQPKPAPCPDCLVRALPSPEDRFKLELLLNPKFPGDTRFETPALWLSGPRGIKRIGLDAYTQTSQWRAGGSVVVEGIDNPWPQDDFGAVKALLEVTVLEPGAKVADVSDSVLRIKDDR